jgi:hypothetical protein
VIEDLRTEVAELQASRLDADERVPASRAAFRPSVVALSRAREEG